MRFACRNCGVLLGVGIAHPALGGVCPVCLRPFAKRRRGRGTSSKRLAKKRLKIAARDGWQCHLCKGYVDPKAEGLGAPTLDHLVPVSLGGSNADENLKLAHAGCNHQRGNALLQEATA